MIKDKKGNMRRFLVKRFNNAVFKGKEILIHDSPIVVREIWEENVYEVKDTHFNKG